MASNYESELLHPGGGIINNLLVYEPLGRRRYLVHTIKNKNILSVASPHKEKKTKKILFWILEIENKYYRFIDNPLNKLVFQTPSNESVQKYVNNNYKVLSSNKIYKKLKIILKVYTDTSLEIDYNILVLIILLSWIAPHLQTIFYLFIIARFGSGKTAILETLRDLCRHGFMAGNCSSAVIGRLVDQQKLTLMFDEFDVKTKQNAKGGDSEETMITRQGQRKGNFYVRWNSKKNEPDIADPYGVKVFTLHSSVEKALSTRGLPLQLTVSKDRRIPIINIFKSEGLKPVFEDLFFWYVDNILVSQVSEVSNVSHISYEGEVDKIREDLYKNATKFLTKTDLLLFKDLFGRNIEIGFIALLISKIYDINIVKDLKETFEYKQELEDDDSENIILQTIRAELSNQYANNKNINGYVKEGIVIAEVQKIHDKVKNRMSQMDMIPIGRQAFHSYMREAGCIDRVNYKKTKIPSEISESNTKSVTCVWFDDTLLKFIGEDKEKLGKLEKHEKPGKSLTYHKIPQSEKYCSVCKKLKKLKYEGNNQYFCDACLGDLPQKVEEIKVEQNNKKESVGNNAHQ